VNVRVGVGETVAVSAGGVGVSVGGKTSCGEGDTVSVDGGNAVGVACGATVGVRVQANIARINKTTTTLPSCLFIFLLRDFDFKAPYWSG
jgi:hypothetical protein